MATGDNAEIEARLQAVRAKRGYLLPHHGLLAITSPAMLEAYDHAYTELAIAQRVLSPHDREFVWLAILIATDEALATHHIAKFQGAGGTDAEVEAAIRLTAWAVGARAYAFVQEHWRAHLPGIDVGASYRAALAANAGDVKLRIAVPAAAAVHAARGDWFLLEQAIMMAYAREVPEVELAEAISLMMFPGSVPRFVEAAGVWLGLIRARRVTPSPSFAAWAALEGQGGFDEASGKTR
ncbi:carboxymuconolactone decarboxylase family protein [Elioraea rosea]|uniref:carboxymuconolactone decarboxylase family protein n=1 Tax=Elioraea rosea TaxID=2492390 RepID=UPI0013156128|nr:carboxymuconolactone decarboxylase family protein [Elioraea rosea]